VNVAQKTKSNTWTGISGGKFMVGCTWGYNTQSGVAGPYDNVRYYQYVLNQTQITNIYNFENIYPSSTFFLVTVTPVPLTSSTNYSFTTDGSTSVTTATGNYIYANGTYVITATSEYAGWPGYSMFNAYTTGYKGWFTNNSSYNGDGTYSGGTSTVSSGSTIKGEYCQIKLPYKLNLTSYSTQSISGIYDITSVKLFYLVASNDGTTWTTIDSQTLGNNGSAYTTNFTLSSNTSYYQYYRFIASIGYSNNYRATGLGLLTLNGNI
jgi:hypothetical protein